MAELTGNEGTIKLWRVFVNFIKLRPKLFLLFMAAQSFFILISYSEAIGFEQALWLTIVIDILWLIAFIVVPALFELILKIIVFIIVCVAAYTIWRSMGAEGLLQLVLIFFICLIALAILSFILILALYCFPGILLASLTYSATDSSLAAFIVFIITTAITIFLVYVFSKYIMPFIFGFGLNWITLAAVNQIGVSLVVGLSLFRLFNQAGDFDFTPTIYGIRDLYAFVSPLPSLFKMLTFLPTPLYFWSIMGGIFCGLLNTPFRNKILRTGGMMPPLYLQNTATINQPGQIFPTSGVAVIPQPAASQNTAIGGHTTPFILSANPIGNDPSSGVTNASTGVATPSAQRYCWNCGKLIEHQGFFCSSCGADQRRVT